MRRNTLLTLAFALSALVAMLPGQLRAQDINLEPASSPSVSAGLVVPGPLGGTVAPLPDSFGTRRGFTFIGASHFAVSLSSSAPKLSYASVHFYTSPGSASPTRYFAQADLEQGVLLDMVTCVFNDSSATNNIYTALQKYSTDLSAGSTTSSTLASNTTSGSAGIGFVNMSLTTPETISNLSGNTMTQYYLAADIASDTSFAGCYLFWKRQVSPAPGVASFSDVPTSHWAFQYIEAVKNSGITLGCAAGLFCPEATMTRAEMAVFLARGFGLSY